MRNLGLVESGDGYFGMAARRDEKKHHSFKILPSRMKEIEKRKKKRAKKKKEIQVDICQYRRSMGLGALANECRDPI